MEIHHLNDHIRGMTAENEALCDQLEVKMREHAKLIAETIKHADSLNVSELSKDLEKRNTLLSEENQILFDQVANLKAHFESFNEQYASRIEKADDVIGAYDNLSEKHSALHREFTEICRQKEFLEFKYQEQTKKLATVEEVRKIEIMEIAKLREERESLHREMQFNKSMVDGLKRKI